MNHIYKSRHRSHDVSRDSSEEVGEKGAQSCEKLLVNYRLECLLNSDLLCSCTVSCEILSDEVFAAGCSHVDASLIVLEVYLEDWISIDLQELSDGGHAWYMASRIQWLPILHRT